MKAMVSIMASVAALAFSVLPVVGVESKPLSEVKPLERASELIGQTVMNHGGSLSGTVKDIVLGDDNKRVEYLAVAFAGYSRLYRLAFSEFDITPDGAALICDVNDANIGAMPGISSTEWPANDDARRVSKVLGLPVRDNQNRPVGAIRDLLIATDDGRVTEATVTVGGFMGLGKKLASIAWDDVRLPIAERFARVDLSVGEVRALAYSTSRYWQRLGFGGMPAEERARPAKSEPMKEPSAPEDDPFYLY